MLRWTVGTIAAVLVLFLAVKPARAIDYIGAEKCGACHQVEYQQWLTTGHASALTRLSKVQQKDGTCRACHTMSPPSDDVALQGVQCESCHGAGKLYAPRYVMRDAELSRLLALQTVTEEQCASCHSKDSPSVKEFSFEEAVALVRHRPPKAEKKGR